MTDQSTPSTDEPAQTANQPPSIPALPPLPPPKVPLWRRLWSKSKPEVQQLTPAGHQAVITPHSKKLSYWEYFWQSFLWGSNLERLAAEVEIGWASLDPQVRDLLISLEAKWRASHDAYRGAATAASLSFFAGMITLLSSGVVLWTGREHLFKMLDEGKSVGWQSLVISSGSVALLVAIATLVFKVADRYAQLARQHGIDADATRRLQASVRLMMAFGKVHIPSDATEEEKKMIFQTADNYGKFALKLLDGTPSKEIAPQEIGATPEVIHELGELIAKVAPKK